VNNGFIQKRKYQKGYHLSLKKKIKPVDYIKSDEVELFKNQELIEPIASKGGVSPDVPAMVKTNSSIAKESQNSTTKVITKNEMTQVLKHKAKENHGINNGIKKITSANFRNHSNATSHNPNDDDMLLLLYVLAVLIPFVAVGIVTDWDVTDVIINLLLCILCYIPGIIHAFIKIRDNY
jgi:uncharacterized membrane protein YqaE (UPF0057 family)